MLNLDLNCVVNRMVHIHGWTKYAANEVRKQYENFLALKKENWHVQLPPSIEIDEFWHNHILYTQKYHRDCMFLFGRYLHHYPHGKDLGASYRIIYVAMFEMTQNIYFSMFGEYLMSVNCKSIWRKMYEKVYHYVI